MSKIATIIGTRPQYVKMALLSKMLSEAYEHVVIDTGQHYDFELSQVFLDELDIERPDYNLNVGSTTPGRQVAEMLIGLEEILLKEKPALAIVCGDTNSALAGALAATKTGTKLAHVEAGPRGDRCYPEEANRIVVDHLSDLLFCPTLLAVTNLEKEGITEGVYLTGDVTLDTILKFVDIAKRRSNILEQLSLQSGGYILITFHHTDSPSELEEIIAACLAHDERVVFPIHPRTRRNLESLGLYNSLNLASHVTVIKPVGYIDFIELERNARKIVTDSGGVQREAYFLKVPCITVLKASEWPETIEDGWNTLVNHDRQMILEHIHADSSPRNYRAVFGDGTACTKIVRVLSSQLP